MRGIRRVIRVGVVGNPNVGKSVIFNRLTGGRAWVGNWPGVTVEKKVGRFWHKGFEVEVVDLPGIYSLTAYSLDELIARNFVVEERPDVVVDIVNAASLVRSLYLTISLLEMGANLVVALNMVDLAEELGFEVDPEALSKELGVPVVPMIAIKGVGFEELKDRIVEAASHRLRVGKVVDYGELVERAIEEVSEVLARDPELASKYPLRWIAIKLLEGDRDVEERLKERTTGLKAVRLAERLRVELSEELGVELEEYIVDRRYERALEVARACIKAGEVRHVTLTDVIDMVVTHRVFGVPILLTVLYLGFKLAFDVAAPFSDLLDVLFSEVLREAVLSAPFLGGAVKSLIADGIIVGVGNVLVFLPSIALLYLYISVLEDLGYMARAAFVVDKLMYRLGLTGRSFIPIFVGFGCNVPAVLATRTIPDENERIVTALVVPLASCAARLPVYLLLAGAFFPSYVGSVVVSMYLLGIALIAPIAFLLRKFVLKRGYAGFVMELPPYMTPMLRNVAIKTWERTKGFLRKASSIILAATVLAWLLSVTGPSGYLGPAALESPELLEKSWISVIGRIGEAVFAPMGWDWRASAALFYGLIAKEAVVSSMAILYGVGEEELSEAIKTSFTPLTAYAYMAFVLIYLPCVATLAALRSELGWKYALLALAYELALAYVVALAIVAVGSMIGL